MTVKSYRVRLPLFDAQSVTGHDYTHKRNTTLQGANVDTDKLQATIERLVKPYLENCAGLGRDAYDRIDAFAKAVATQAVNEVKRQEDVRKAAKTHSWSQER
jgi:hypothetical protein